VQTVRKCTSVCPVKAIVPSVQVQRTVHSEGPIPTLRRAERQFKLLSRLLISPGIALDAVPAPSCVPMRLLNLNSIPRTNYCITKTKGGDGYKRGGRRNDPSISTLDRLSLRGIDAYRPRARCGRHEFRIRSLLGRCCRLMNFR